MKVRLEGVGKSFGNVEALRPLNLEIADREFVTLVGPSGSGKSTLVRLLAGLERPSTGTIMFDDEPVEDLAANERDIAMVFQSYALYPHMTVELNLGFPLRMMRTPKDVVRARVREVAEILGIGDLLSRKPRELSGGQRQRVALGRAMVRRPGIFLLDEPLSNLDAQLRVAMRTEIKRLHTLLQTTFVYVTHDQAEALTMSDRIVVLDHGSIQQLGTPADVYGNPVNKFVAQFIGSPPMATLDGRIESVAGRTAFVTSAFTIELPHADADLRSGPVAMGIRPEDVRVSTTAADGMIEARVYTREPLGSDLYLTLDLDGGLIRARVDDAVATAQGERIWVRFPTARLYFFDPASGVRIGHQVTRVN